MGGLHLLDRRPLLGGQERHLVLDELLPDARVVQVEEDQERDEHRHELFLDRASIRGCAKKPKMIVNRLMKMPNDHA